MKLLPIIVFLAVLTTAGCQGGALPTASAPLGKADIATIETSLTVAIDGANACLSLRLGPCGQPASRLDIIADIHKAHDAFKRLQAASDAGQPAALSAFQAALTQLRVDVPAKQ